MTATLTSTRPLNPNRVPIGVDSTQQWLELRFSGIENPHILICGGSQTGKTTLQILAAAVAASRGNIVIILDPKLRFSRAFRDPKTGQPLPNVLVYRDADDAIAAREWHGILAQVTAEMQQRYRGDDQADADVLDDQARFPNILVVADELGTLLDFADKEWPYRKPDGYKGNTPIREMIHTLSRMGAEAHVFGCFANQTAKEDELPAGTKTRSLCGQRIFLGPVQEGAQWRMLAGEGIAPPDTPENQKGAGAVLFNNGKPIRFQGGYLDWKNHPEKVHNLAAQGLPVLREHGHLDEHDRLILAGVPVPPPGKMASHVASGSLDLLDGAAAEPAPTVDVSAAISDPDGEPVEAAPEEPVITGLGAAAEFCGLSVANFRRVREQHPIEGELANAKGNKPGWYESDLRVWKMRYTEHRTQRQKGAAA